MNLTPDRLRSIGWSAVFGICLALMLGLTFKVNAVRGQVRQAERQIITLRQEKLFLETEYETRANQQQLKAMNDVEFGYQAPSAGQYLQGERDLAQFSKPQSPDAPAPIRMASADQAGKNSADGLAGFPAMVSPVTGKAMAAQGKIEASQGDKPANLSANLSERLSRLGHVEATRD